MARFLKPLVRSGGYYPSRRWTPLVYPGGYTTANGGEEPAPPPIEKTITGNPIHILDALAKPAEALSVKLEPVQDLNGYSYPWPAGGGDNLLPFDSIFTNGWTNTEDGVTATYNDGIMRVTGTNNSGGWVNIVSFNSYWKPKIEIGSGTFIPADRLVIRVEIDNSGINENESVAFTAQTSAKVIGFYIAVPDGMTVDWTIPMMLVRGSTRPTSYVPYSNICPIYGHTDADVTRTGVNLDPYGDFNNTTRLWGSNNSYQKLAFQSLPVGQYTMSCKFKLLTNPASEANVQYGVLARYSDGNGGYKVIIPYRLTTEAAVVGGVYEWSKTFTISESLANEDTLNVYFYCADGGASQTTANAYDIQIEYGSTASSYSPYVGTTYPIPLGQTVYGGQLDVLTGVLTVDKAYALLNDPDYWIEIPSGTLEFRYERTFTDRKIYNDSYTGLICSFLRVDTSDQSNTARWSGATTYYFGLNLRSVPSITLADIKQAASDGKIAIRYELATPQTIQLTPQQVELLQGENNIWSDGTMTLVYLADGNASDEEALNILLGGRYVNNHSEDEPTDREALNIILGGNER